MMIVAINTAEHPRFRTFFGTRLTLDNFPDSFGLTHRSGGLKAPEQRRVPPAKKRKVVMESTFSAPKRPRANSEYVYTKVRFRISRLQLVSST